MTALEQLELLLVRHRGRLARRAADDERLAPVVEQSATPVPERAAGRGDPSASNGVTIAVMSLPNLGSAIGDAPSEKRAAMLRRACCRLVVRDIVPQRAVPAAERRTSLPTRPASLYAPSPNPSCSASTAARRRSCGTSTEIVVCESAVCSIGDARVAQGTRRRAP